MRIRHALLCCALLAFRGGSARGSDISTITISDAGPDKTIPTDAAFYLAGPSKSATRVQALIVRTDRPYLGTKETCDQVAGSLGKFKVALADLKAGPSATEVLWESGKKSWRVQISPPWVPPPEATTAPTDFKILIDHDEDFFSAGHGYCIFIYRDIKKTKQLPDVADALLAAFKTAMATCQNNPVCVLDRTQIDLKISAITDAKIKLQVNTAANESYKHANDMVRGRETVRELLNKWGHHPPSQTSLAISAASLPAILTGGTAETTTALLAYHAKVLPKVGGTAAIPTFDGYVTPKADFVISGVSFIGADRIRLVPKPPADPTKTSVLDTVKTGELTIPDTTISLRDVLELLQGRLPLGKEYLTSEDYLRRLDPILLKDSEDLTDDETRTLQAAVVSLKQLDTAVQYIHEIHARYPNPDRGSRAGILFGLAKWMIPYEVDCNAANALTRAVVTCSATPGVSGWDTYDSANQNPISRLAAAVERFATAQPQWLKTRPLIPNSTTTPTPFAEPLSVKINYTRDTWFFSFVSPVVGYAFAQPKRSGERENITIRYYGLQLHHTPNPEHLPTLPWKAGGLAFELGATPDAGSFGPDKRYRGLGNVAPIFFGFGIHLIPYTTLSGGVMVAERRTSSITQEDYRRFYGGYLGLSVDVNIPQLVRKSVNGGTATSTTK